MPSNVSITGRPLEKGVSVESPHSMRHAWGMIFRFMRRYRTLFVIGIILVFIESLLNVFAPNYISDITDLISDGLYTGDIDLDAVSRIGILVLLLYVFAHGASFMRNFVMADVAERVAGDMRSSLNRKLSRLPMDYFDSSDKGDVISRFTNDSDTVGSALNRSISVFLHGIFVLILCTAMMFITNVKLAIVSIAAALIGFGVCFAVMKYTQKYYRTQQRNIGSMYGLISEIYSSHALVQSYSGERLNRRKFDGINETLRSSGFRSEITMSLLPAVMHFAGHLGYVLVCIVGSVMVIQGEITIGMVVAFILFEKMFMGPLDMISSSLGNLQAAGAGAERIYEVLDHDEMPADPENEYSRDVEGMVEFSNVHFSYIPGTETIKGFSVKVEPGQKVAIVGATGAGKTTVVNLLMKFYDVSEGDILIDGTSIKDMSRAHVHSFFCMVLQDTWLFNGTIRDNIAYGTEVSDDDVYDACRKVGLEGFIRALPEGLDTKIRNGGGLSEGQRQQICIARALVDRSPMLILDEATSMVDSRTEMVIQRAIDTLMEGRTTFVIAHRLSTIVNADVILVMEDGNIVEKGRHEELLSRGGVYADLYRSQFDVAGD
ncbi:MAG: ABC transporter ATP-binding protein [Candidatus Methanomethylophilaceae archaeon]|nr:ABC transporter ATP-binding protein [Candidatus Methanomethylophilaceae archaeon]